MEDSQYAIPAAMANTLVDAEAYADNRLFEAYRWLRANNPLGFAAPDGFDPFWVITKHSDLTFVSRNSDLFHNGDRAPVITDRASDELIKKVTGGSPHLFRSLIHLDAPEHPKLRGLTQQWFMPANLRKLEEKVRALARKAIDEMLATGGSCDFVKAVTLHYPLRVVMEILGVPAADEPLMLKLTQEIFAPLDPDLGPRIGIEAASAQLGKALQQTVAAFGEYFSKLSAERRHDPQNDVISVIANAKVDGQPLPPDVELGYYLIVATAGHDTTSSSTAGAMRALCENPNLFEAVQKDRQLIPALVDEAVRWTTPVKTFMRTATRDTTVRDRNVKAGDWLMLCYASANRDEDVFEDPDVFRLDRGSNRQLAFGHGVHSCLGQHLARLEMKFLYDELFLRVKSVRLEGAPEMTKGIFVNGLKSLPIRFEAA